MRRLIELALAPIRRIRLQVAEQHLADLEKMLSSLVDSRDRLNTEIAETTHRLLMAADHYNALSVAHSERMKANPTLKDA